ncbi:MAG: orotidine-5'-phosphate decarboxylase [Candidatus Omnitrophica bacterium]|nr:orotidine-5'-phosphate decarboxylase [Candidatus Omnitrophota bacterium]
MPENENPAKLIVALDTDSLFTAEEWVKKLSSLVKIFKVGSELYTAYGPSVIEMVRRNGGEVFLDLKFHDIPNTIAQSCKMAIRQNVFMLNIHSHAGRAALVSAVDAVNSYSKERHANPPILLGVTVLTSINEEDWVELGYKRGINDQVQYLAKMCEESGLSGVIASPMEIKSIREACRKEFIIVTPGVRPADSKMNDQKRTATPEEAIRWGADYIVVGRPITQAKEPARAAEAVIKAINV